MGCLVQRTHHWSPLYYATDRVDGRWQTRGPFAGESYRAALHVGWEAWWTKEGLPKEARTTKAAEGIEGIELPKKLPTKRWFNDGALKEGDQFIPLLAGYNGNDFVGHPSAFYLLRSDLKGAVLVNCLPLPQQRGVDRDTQAYLLPRAYLTYLAHGIEVYCWYEFRDGGLKPDYNEHNFGMIDFHVKPKPAYHALQALAKVLGPRPSFAGPPTETQPGLMCVNVRSTEGRLYAIYWAVERTVKLSLDTARTRNVRTHFGESADFGRGVPKAQITVGLAPVFVEVASFP